MCQFYRLGQGGEGGGKVVPDKMNDVENIGLRFPSVLVDVRPGIDTFFSLGSDRVESRRRAMWIDRWV